MYSTKEIIYLCGQISVAAPESFNWRKRVSKYFENRSDFTIIDPCLDEFNTTMVENGCPDRKEIYQAEGIKLIVPRDRIYVTKSTIGLCNMNHYDPKKPLIGTMFELAWYFDAPEKAVIGIYDGNPEDDLLSNHPFVKRAINTWVRTETKACELIEYYFKKKH